MEVCYTDSMKEITKRSAEILETVRAPESPSARADSLLAWYRAHRRHLPWREDPTPYHVWLSEIMLQQTRVEAVRDYYARFLRTLPTIDALAAADEDVYLKLWEGLGYYSRVRNLHKAAVQIVTEHGGQMPCSSRDLQKLAGIGPYTSAAIASICFGERIPALDGNLLRVFARMTGYEENIKTDAAKKAARDWYLEVFPPENGGDMKNAAIAAGNRADTAGGETIAADTTASGETIAAGGTASGAADTLSENRCGDMNQALMDLGATICLPNGQPLCETCPWAEHCVAHRNGRELDLPVIPAKKQRRIDQKTVFLIYYDQKLALRKRPDRGLLAGLYEFPNTGGHLDLEDAVSYVQSLGFTAIRLQRLPETKHIFSHREWHMIGWQVLADEWEDFASGAPRNHELFLATADELANVYSIPSAFAKYQAEIRGNYL